MLLLGLANTLATSTEALMQFWLATGLGFCLNLIEQSFDQLFNLTGEPQEYTEFNAGALPAQKDRIEALVRGVEGGVYSPNDARVQKISTLYPTGTSPECSNK